MNTTSLEKKLGFTLIEILVVLSIIALLSSVALFSTLKARGAARDDIRVADLKRMQIAIELYKSETGVYPASCNAGTWGGNVKGSLKCSNGSTEYIVGLVSGGYISSLPKDSLANTYGATSNQGYVYVSDGINYKLLANNTVEVKKITSYNNQFARCNAATGSTACPNTVLSTTYAVYSNKGSFATNNTW